MRRLDANGGPVLIAEDGAPLRRRFASEEGLVLCGHGAILGWDEGRISIGGIERPIAAVRQVIPPRRAEALEAEAYRRTDTLLGRLPEGETRQTVETAYHEIATNALRVLMVFAAIAEPGIAAVLLDTQTAAAFNTVDEPAPGGIGWVRSLLRPAARGLRQARKMREVVARARMVRSRISSAGGGIILLTTNDSGSGVNLRPLETIEAELQALGVGTFILTEVDLVVADARARGSHNVVRLDGDLRALTVRLPPPIFPAAHAGPDLSAALNRAVSQAWPKYVARRRRIRRALALLDRVLPVRAVLSIPETLPVSIAAGQWARAKGRPWFGHFTTTVGKVPDHYFFPATMHLVYGGQLADHIAAAGRPRQAIHVTGCPSFDAHLGRDRVADRATVEADFVRTRGRRLVLVTSEAFPDPETELVPILAAASHIEGAHVILKLHPDDRQVDMEALASRAGAAGIDIVARYPLGRLLGAADLLVSVMSTVIIEAAVIGTPILCCDFSGKTAALDFVAEGLCAGCKEPGAVAGAIARLLFDSDAIAESRRMAQTGIARFNGPNDGRSARRIAGLVASTAGLTADQAGMAPQI